MGRKEKIFIEVKMSWIESIRKVDAYTVQAPSPAPMTKKTGF